MEVKHCIMDLKDYIEGLRARLKRNAEAMDAMTSSAEYDRCSVNQWVTIDFMSELERITAAWERGIPSRTSTQVAMGKKE